MTDIWPEPFLDVVRRRRSCRSFDGRALEAERVSDIVEHAAGCPPPFGTPVRLGLIDVADMRAQNLFTTGAYGLIKGARGFLAGVIPRGGEGRFEDLGWVLETAVLRAAAIGVGSCWIGGVFDRRRFGARLQIAADEQLPAVIALGRPAVAPSLRDKLVRWSAGGDHRRPLGELVFAERWGVPHDPDAVPEWHPLWQALRLGPSASNRQPWRLLRQGEAWHLFLSRHAGYKHLIPQVDLQRIDMGIALCHLHFAAQATGCRLRLRSGRPDIPGLPAGVEHVTGLELERPGPAR